MLVKFCVWACLVGNRYLNNHPFCANMLWMAFVLVSWIIIVDIGFMVCSPLLYLGCSLPFIYYWNGFMVLVGKIIKKMGLFPFEPGGLPRPGILRLISEVFRDILFKEKGAYIVE